ncbi:alpha/beta hydrolase [Rhizobium sp. CC-YZS058]|uniref:alpha/beta hydrolase n=1 Tax=Rhizobium sp. CC-YZS058 TaxID=3042153 RepID=UPI002B054B9B|nr:alpha/beta hydrolase [Rhizobium sp. CC-YZS058]MEA3534327.1 alpha/beta hydrolase [Rhizobium sp. CC-YZS058]
MTGEWREMAVKGQGGVPLSLRLHAPAAVGKCAPLVLFLGGGAFLDKGLPQETGPAVRALGAGGAIVLEADYATASGNGFPQALDTAFEALQHVSAKRKHFGGGVKAPLFVAGTEAGGNVAAGVALKARDQMPGGLTGQILLSPMIDPRMTTHSIRRASEIGMLDRWSDGWRNYLRETLCGTQHPYAAPCLCSRLMGVAPALVLTSEDDPLKDEALGYADRLAQGGSLVRRTILPDSFGWTGIYRGKTGLWVEALRTAFSQFVEELRPGARPGLRAGAVVPT